MDGARDGSEFPVDITLSAVETTKGRLTLGVVRDLTERERLAPEMRYLVSSDPVTGLGNYRRLQEAFESGRKWSQRTCLSFALVLVDLDGLKRINDNHGHLVGSRALCRLADVLRSECRAVDTAARRGRDEFAVILPETDSEGARNLALRLASRVATDGEDPPVSFSFGVAVYSRDGETLDQLLGAADRALYVMNKSRS